jgi:hypothetical protein
MRMSTDEIIPRAIHLHEFEPMVGQVILADCQPRAAELVLVEASPIKQRTVTERLPFILIFRSKPEVQLVEAAYKLRCGEFGPELVHIIPLGPHVGDDVPGNYYQAVFN